MLSGNKSFFSYFTKKNACNNKVVNNKPVEKIKPKSLRKISKEIKIHEYSTEDFNIDPSFGSHFFQNIISLRIGYFTINKNTKDEFIDWNWLKNNPIKKKTKSIKWIELKEPLFIQLDGTTGTGIIMKPQEKKNETMDERESTGI